MREKMAPWTFVLIGSLLTLAGGVMVTYGWAQLKQKDEAYSLSVPPSIDISIWPNDETKMQDVIFRNTGQHTLKDVEVWSILYEIKASEVVSRSIASKGELIADNWEPQSEVVTTSSKFTFWPIPPSTEDDRYHCIALVTVYRRKLDNRRYVDITPFTFADIVNRKVLFPTLGSSTASTGPPQGQIKVFREIIDTEKFFFKAN